MENRYYVRGLKKKTYIKIFQETKKESRYQHLVGLLTSRTLVLDNGYQMDSNKWY